MDLLTHAEKVSFDFAMQNLFDTFARPLLVYQEAQVVNISTSPTFSRFGQHDQNAAVNADNTAVTPQIFTITGCILYNNKQPWDYIAPVGGNDSNAQQDKLRNAFGLVRVKVDATGYGLLANAKLVRIDGFDFNPVATPRPHGLVGAPNRWTLTYQVKQ